MRCQKTNANRGTTYSQWSAWAKPGTRKEDTSTLSKPVLVNIYNSAGGADIRFREVSGADSYVIMRKENKVWKEVTTVKASSLSKDGGNYKYIDTSVKTNYGKGYIYSVAARKGNVTGPYDTRGLAFYRLQPPTITSVTVDGTSVTVHWNKVEAHGYEIYYSSDGGKTWQFGMSTNEKSDWAMIYRLEPNTNYIFRMRCQKTNASRGTTYSQWSNWGKAVTR